MKLNKKFLACFMAATMAIAPMTAFGDSASSTVTGTGTVNIPETEKYNVILPTSEGISFNVDPYGLLSVEEDDMLGEVLSGAATAESITSNPTAVINKITMDIKVKASAYLTTSTTCALSLATSEAAVVSGTSDLYLAITPYTTATVEAVTAEAITADKITGDAAVISGTSVITDIDITTGALNVASATAVTATTESAANVLNIELGDMANAYTVTTGGTVALSESAVTYTSDNTYVFKIAGKANPKADAWKTLDGGSINLVMKFEISSGAEVEVLTATGSPTTGVTLTYNGSTPLVSSYLKINGIAVNTWSTYAANARFNGSTVTIGTALMSGSVKSAAVNGVYTIEVKDTAGTTYTVNVQ